MRSRLTVSLATPRAITKAIITHRSSSHHRDIAPTSHSINSRNTTNRSINNRSMGSRRISNRNTAVRGNGLRTSNPMDTEARLSYTILHIKATISTMSIDTGTKCGLGPCWPRFLKPHKAWRLMTSVCWMMYVV